MERKSYVYKIMCKITGEFYFGSSFNAKRDWYWGGGKRIRERISQYGKDNFIKEILGEFEDRTESHRVENQYIEKFRHDEKCLNIHLDYHFGTYGEESRVKNSYAHRGEKNHNFGKHRTEEVKSKIGAANRGKHHTEETRAKLSAAFRGEKNPLYGKHLSEEAKEKISASLKGLMSGENHPMYGKHRTEETRAKISAAQRGKIVSDYTRAKLSAARRGKHWRKNPVTGKREYYD